MWTSPNRESGSKMGGKWTLSHDHFFQGSESKITVQKQRADKNCHRIVEYPETTANMVNWSLGGPVVGGQPSAAGG